MFNDKGTVLLETIVHKKKKKKKRGNQKPQVEEERTTQQKRDKRTNNDLQNIRQKTKDPATRTLTYLILGRQKQNKWLKQD